MQTPAGVEKCGGIRSPLGLVEIGGQEAARVVLEERVHAGDKRLARGIAAGEVPADDVLGHREEPLVRAPAALDAGLLADATPPLARAGGGVAGPACRPALE